MYRFNNEHVKMNGLSYFLLSLYFFQVDAKPASKTIGLIVNGNDATRGEYPSQAMMFIGRNNYFICGGTILNENYILTAAHCVYNNQRASKYTIAVGKHEMETDLGSEQYRGVKKITIHEDYNDRTTVNDIALMELDSPITFDNYVQPVTLATDSDAAGKKCYATGFGVVNERTDAIASTLQELRTRVITERKCKKFARRYNSADLIDDTVVCTKDKKAGVCSGDSGGPVGCYDSNNDYIQFGVLSWGSTKCVQGFNVYTRVSTFRDWISSNMS